MPDILIKQAITGEAGVLATDEITTSPIDQFFNETGENVSKDDRQKITDIDKWLSTQTDDLVKKYSILKDMRYRLGTPPLGKSPIAHLHQYIMLRQAANENESMAKAMEQ